MNLRSKKLALLFSIGVLLAMSYVDYSLERAALEAEYGLKEPINRASPPHIEPAQLSLSLHIELVRWSLQIIAGLICAFGLTVYLRTLSVAMRWSFISIFAVANILFEVERFKYIMGKDPYTYYENYMYLDSVSFLSISVSLLVVAFLLVCGKRAFTKVLGVLLLCLSIFGWFRLFGSIINN